VSKGVLAVRVMKIGFLSALVAALIAAPAAADTLRVSDDQELQQALDTAQPGDTIAIAPGTYTGPFDLEDANDVRIIGKGGPVITSGRELRGLVVDSCRSIEIRGLVFEGTGATSLLIGDSEDVEVSRCTVRSSFTDGIVARGGARLVFDRCRVEDSRGDGIALLRNVAQEVPVDSLVTRCTIIRVGGNGVWLYGDGCTVTKTNVVGVDEDGIRVTRSLSSKDNTVSKCKLTGTGENAIAVTAVGTSIEKCSIRDAGENGIEIDGDGSSISKVKIRGARERGVLVTANECELLKIKISGAGSDAVRITGTDTTVTKCTATKNGGVGFSLGGTSDDIVLSRNKAKRNDGGSVVDASEAGNTIEPNNKF
jgi:nitrous oxidase accessory protein NosD